MLNIDALIHKRCIPNTKNASILDDARSLFIGGIIIIDVILYYHHLSGKLHLFYNSICSGLSVKTKLILTSSNSSFSECMRKYNPLSNSYGPIQEEGITIMVGDHHHFENTTGNVKNNTH